jgi:DUF1680 family protein
LKTPVDTRRSRSTRWRGLALNQVALTERAPNLNRKEPRDTRTGFWATRQAINRDASLRHGYRMLEKAGNLHNLRLAGGSATGDYRGPVFQDSDVYKWLEAMGYEARRGLSPDLLQMADDAIGLVERAQAPDGYLDSYYQVVAPNRRWLEINTGHELYCAGHLIQAAVAWHRCAADTRLLDVAQRVVAHIESVFGPDRRPGTPGHPEIEMALVELYRDSGVRRYLELAQFFVDQRGYGILGPNPRFGGSSYYQDRVPVRDASTVEGHAVRALYLAAGVADVYLESGERALLDALVRQWDDLVDHKLYLTGGAGSRHQGEAFGQPYELPTERAYCETCAAIASVFWSWRMLLISGQGRYADLIERTLYNGFLSGVSLDGRGFFYVNPLLSRGAPDPIGRGVVQRREWYQVACCPPNVMRLLASIGHYFASSDGAGLQVHQYVPATLAAELEGGRRVDVRVETDYPWADTVALTVAGTDDAPWQLRLRIPSWCSSASVALNGASIASLPGPDDYVLLDRSWRVGDRVDLTLPMPPRLTLSHPRVEATNNMVAIERGPIVYCVEQADHADADVLDLEIDAQTELEAEWRADLLGGVTVIRAHGGAVGSPGQGSALYRPYGQSPPSRRSVPLTAIPYYAWANRTPGPMRVWIPLARG